MKSISLYGEKSSLLSRLSPENKILYVLSAVFIPIFIENHMVSTGFILLSALPLFDSGIVRKTVPILGVPGFMVFTVLLIQGLFRVGNETALSGILGLTFYKEGLMFALGVAINVFNIILCFYVLVLCIKPPNMTENFVRRGFSSRFGYVFIPLFQLIPQMMEKMTIITDTQKNRGMETEENLLVRIKTSLPLISPIVISSFIDTREQATALEVHGFNVRSKKAFLNEQHTTALDKVIQGFLILGIIGAIG